MADYRNRPIRGTRDEDAINPALLQRDIKPWTTKISKFLADRNNALLLMSLGPILIIYNVGYLIEGFLWTWIIYICHQAIIKKQSLPLKLPLAADQPDPHSIAPGGKKLNRAKGTFFIGNEKGTNEELWLDNGDVLTHGLVLGTTGSGKTETLVSMAFNGLAMGSGLLYVDAKASPKLAHQIYGMARFLGREDDFYCLNFGVMGKGAEAGHRLSNTCNPFCFGTPEILSDLLCSLMPETGAGGEVFSAKGQVIISALMRGLVDLRDKGHLVISPGLIREHLSAKKFVELSRDLRLSENTRKSLESALLACNYVAEVPFEKQKAFHEQFGFGQAYFGQILSSLTDTYGHIFDVEAGEIDFRDIVQNRRILVVLLPAMEKSAVELQNLGRLVLACLKAAAATGLGMKIEGDPMEILANLASNFNATGPFLTIVDEYAAITTKGFEILLTQGRSLGMATIVASQDYAGILEADPKGAQQIVANTNYKIFMKLQEPEKTYELLKGLAGEDLIASLDGWEHQNGGYTDNFKASVERKSRVDLRDLMQQTEGEAHIIYAGNIIRANTFFADPQLAGFLRLNRKLQMTSMDDTTGRKKNE